MPRALAVLIALALILPTTDAAPNVKDGNGQPVYCPTRLGAKWVFDEGGRERSLEVTQVETKGDEMIISISNVSDNTPQPYEKVSVTSKGVFRIGSGAQEAKPTCVFRIPVKKGETWMTETESTRQMRGEKRTVTVGDTEEIEVPAGKFKAVRIEITITETNGFPLETPERYITWHAPEVGMVKTTLNGKTIRTLKSFAPGKK